MFHGPVNFSKNISWVLPSILVSCLLRLASVVFEVLAIFTQVLHDIFNFIFKLTVHVQVPDGERKLT